MRPAYRQLIAVLGVFGFANAFASSFLLIVLLDQGLPEDATAAFFLAGFALAAAGCALYARGDRPGRTSVLVGLLLLLTTYAAFAILTAGIGSLAALFAIAAVGWGLSIPTFWLPYNTYLARTTSARDRASKFGGTFLAIVLAGIVAPPAGGLVADLFGFPVVFGVAAGLLAAVGVVLARLLAEERMVFHLDLTGMGRPLALAFFAEGSYEGVFVTAVPLSLYAYTQKPTDLGLLFSLFALAGGATTITASLLSDRLRNRRAFLGLSVGASAPLTAALALSAGLDAFVLFNGLLALSLGLAPVMIFTLSIDRQERNPAAAVATREFLLNLGRAVLAGAVVVLVVLGSRPQTTFLLAVPFISLLAVAR